MTAIKEPEIGVIELRKMMHVDEHGVLRWSVARTRGVKPGDQAGTVQWDGYRAVGLRGRTYRAHRIVWALSTGEWPLTEIDHINGLKDDNRICNLRLATKEQNQQNRPAHSGHALPKGVTLHKQSGKYQAQIGAGGKTIYLGLFDAPDAAGAAYARAAKRHHGEFACVQRSV